MATAFNAWSEQCTAARNATEDLALNIGADTAATWRGLRSTSDALESAAHGVHGMAKFWTNAPSGLLTRTERAHDAAQEIVAHARAWVACVMATPPDLGGAREALKALNREGAMLTVAGMWLNHEDAGTLHDPLHADDPRPERDLVDARASAVAPPSQAEDADALPLTINRSGKSWLLAFSGAPTVALQDLAGIGYIAELLKQPGKSVVAWKLSGREIAPGPGEPAIDAKGRAALTRRVQELQETGGERAVDEAEEIIAQLARGTARNGRARTLGDQAEDARNAVSNAIKRALKAIREAVPPAADYLEPRLSLGKACRFEIEPATRQQ